jgi:hypothetical protein
MGGPIGGPIICIIFPGGCCGGGICLKSGGAASSRGCSVLASSDLTGFSSNLYGLYIGIFFGCLKGPFIMTFILGLFMVIIVNKRESGSTKIYLLAKTQTRRRD